ncbi:MAG: NAD(P)-dependent oxidoreductase [Armatimonadetes bacterium]|nr:NAD(P)-dependent oxidoreductase [Armatimonadota bacterium]
MKVLITGAAGRLGRKLAPALEANHDLILGDVAHLDDPRFVPLDVTDLEAARSAARDCDAIAHLAILDWTGCVAAEAVRYAADAVRVHAIGTYNMLQAAWEAGVRRFVYTSTVSAVDGLPPGTPVGSDSRHYSNGLYGMTKGFGEDLCRMFHESLRLSVTVLRLGNLFIPESGGAWFGNVYVLDLATHPVPGLTPSRVHVDDVTRAIALALETPEPGYALVHVVGDNPGRQWDLEAVRRLYGWQPRYTFGADGLPVAT